jgi:signal transduction histidine kinase
MRRRLILLVFSTTLFALTLLGVILIAVIWTLTSAAQQPRAAATATVAAEALEGIHDAGGRIDATTLKDFVRDDAVLTVTMADGTTFSTGDVPPGDVYTGSYTEGAVTVTAVIPASINAEKLRAQSLLVVAISALALGIAMLVALFYARRITRPLEDFAEMAGRIATGDRRQLGRRYGVPELDAVAEVLDQGLNAFNDLLENERRVTTEASHQLRTPLTALSLRLEEILATDDLDVVRTEATAALGQVERLSGVVDEVVGVRRGTRASSTEPFEMLASQITEWTPAFHAAGRRLVRVGATGLVAVGLAGAQAQALATLIENSLVHGQGCTTIRMRASGTWVVIEVADDGSGVPAELESTVFERDVSGNDSSGLGLALARTLVAADGGRLEMITARPAVFAMFLPARQGAGPGAVPRTEPTANHDEPATGPREGQTVVASVSSPAASVSSGNTQRR